MNTTNNKIERFEAQFGAEKLILEFGQLANLATGSITARWGDTIVLATVCVATEARESVDYFPLMVDYEERLYASGKIKGSRFIKREGRPSDQAILTARLIDRPLRPLFPKNYRKDIQVIVTVLSADLEHDPDIISIIAASAAMLRTHAPFRGPVAACRIGMTDGKFVLNPTATELEKSPLDLVIVYNKEKVMMMEAGAAEVDEKTFLEAIKFGAEGVKPILELQKKLKAVAIEEAEALRLRSGQEESPMDQVYAEIEEFIGKKLAPIFAEMKKEERELKLAEFEEEVLKNFEGNYKQIDLKTAFGKLVEKEVRKVILEKKLRPDGRKLDEIRPIEIEVGLLPRTHGSALFTRGQTQALTIVTLGSPGEEQTIETMDEEGTKRYMHHYNFPPFSTGEVAPIRGVSRREVGHGALAERALVGVIPEKEKFPYTIRLVSEILASNGSSSMAATCGSTLALMDAGVPIKAPVAGIAMGLVSEAGSQKPEVRTKESKIRTPNSDIRHPNHVILTDIQGIEDFSGDMDFKIAGTKEGITAIQLDIKIDGLNLEIVEEAMAQAKKARLEVLAKIAKTLPEPRKELSPFAPRVTRIEIDPAKIGDVIGPGGKMINGMIAECGGKEVTQIDIEEDGSVMITSTDAEMAKKCIEMIKGLTREIKVNEILEGTVSAVQRDRMSGKEIGAIVQLTPKLDGMVHISEIAEHRVEKISDELKIGQKVKVKCVSVDPERGRIGLSIKQAN